MQNNLADYFDYFTGKGDRKRFFWRSAGLILFFFVGARLGTVLGAVTEFGSAVWPPIGIGLFCIYSWGEALIPSLFIASLSYAMFAGAHFDAALFVAVGNCVGIAMGCFFLKRVKFKPALAHVRDVTALVSIGGIFTPVVCTTIALLGRHALGQLPLQDFLPLYTQWCLGGAFGVISTAPSLFVWTAPQSRISLGIRRWELVALIGLLTIFLVVLFHGDFLVFRNRSYFLRPYALFPFFVWATLRFRQRGATGVSAAIFATAFLVAFIRVLPFPSMSMGQTLDYMQSLICMMTITTLFLGAVVCQYQQTLLSLHLNEISIRKQEVAFRTIFDYSGAGHGQFEIGTGKLTRVNKKLCDILKYSQEELLRIDFTKIIHPDDLAKSLSDFQMLLKGDIQEFATEKRYIDKNGKTIWVLVTATIIRDESDLPLSTLAVIQDITDRKTVELELAQAKEAAEAANLAKSQFLANMSHEIRTPLSAILGFNEFLYDTEQSYNDRLLCAERIKRNGDLLLRVIDDVLDLSKIEAGKMEVEKSPVQLPALIEDLSSLLGFKANEKGVKLNITSDGPVPRQIFSDPIRLRQIFINLVGNAIKFSHQGTVDITMRLVKNRTHPGSTHLEFEIKDSGLGMSAEQSTRIFSPFQQADASMTRKYGGSGLGLVLSRNFARALGGDLHLVDSKLGQGSTFAFYVTTGSLDGIAFYQYQPSPTLQAASIANPKPTSMKLQNFNILVVDDVPDNRILFGRYLEREGAKVELAENGEQAVQMALAKPYDVMLIDVQMPILDGLQATAILRSKGYTKPILALTAHAMKEDRLRSLNAGCNEHISKPINPKLFIETVYQFANGTASSPQPAIH